MFSCSVFLYSDDFWWMYQSIVYILVNNSFTDMDESTFLDVT